MTSLLSQIAATSKEGGFFRETYRGRRARCRCPRDRSFSTAIYYLLTPNTFSELHRLASDEVFHFYVGSPVRMLQLFPDGQGREIVLGSDVLAGQQPQVVVPRGVWQGKSAGAGRQLRAARLHRRPRLRLRDYEAGDRATLIAPISPAPSAH